MNSQNRRYIFTDLAHLRKIKLKKLERVCDKVYVFVNSKEQSIPFSLIWQARRFGKNLKWVPVKDPINDNMTLHIAYKIGQLDKEVDQDIEFAILSNDKCYDSLVSLINKNGRSCIRVKRKKTRTESKSVTSSKMPPLDTNGSDAKERIYEPDSSVVDRVTDKGMIDKTASETVKRLIRTGSRPTRIKGLKSFIELNNQELSLHNNADRVIRRLKETNEIQIRNQEVFYNF